MASISRAISRAILLGLAVVALSPSAASLPDLVVPSLRADVAYAADPAALAPAAKPAAAPAAQTPNAAGEVTLDVLNGVISILFMLINPLLALASWLLSPDWTYGDVFSMRPILYKLWILTSNIVYTIFAIVLVVAAFMNIFGVGGNNYQMKSMLPRFVGGIILVPLSWFIVSAVLSISNILTASVLSLPYDIFTSGMESNKSAQAWLQKKIPQKCELDLDKMNGTPAASAGASDAAGAAAPAEEGAGSDGSWKCATEQTVQALFAKSNGSYTILHVYAYGIFNIGSMQKIQAQSTFKTVGDVVFGLFFGTVFFIIFGLLVIGIIFVLFTRVMHLWVFIILSPIFGLLFFLGKGAAKDLESWDIKDFISLALVPVAIAAALSFGMLFVFTVMHHEPDNTDSSARIVSIEPQGADGTTQIIRLGSKEDPVFEFTLKGLPVSQDFNGSGAGLGFGLGVIGHVIVMTIAIFILWIAVKAGAGVSKVTEAAFKPIQSFGSSMGDVITKAPQYIPIIPAGGKDRLSYAGLDNFGRGIQGAVLSPGDANKLGTQFGEKIAAKAGIGQNDTLKAVREALNDQEHLSRQLAGATTNQGAADLLNRLLPKIGKTAEDVASNGDARTELASTISKMNDGAMAKADRDKIVELLKKDQQEASFAEAIKRMNQGTGMRLFGRAMTEDSEALQAWNDKTGRRGTPPTSTPPTSTPPAPLADPHREAREARAAHQAAYAQNPDIGRATPGNAQNTAFNITVHNNATGANEQKQLGGYAGWYGRPEDYAMANAQTLLSLSGLFTRREFQDRMSRANMESWTIQGILDSIDGYFGRNFFNGE